MKRGDFLRNTSKIKGLNKCGYVDKNWTGDEKVRGKKEKGNKKIHISNVYKKTFKMWIMWIT